MYIEDDNRNVIILREYLKNIYGDNILFSHTNTVENGLDKIMEDPPYMLFLDFHLPDGTGIDLYKKIKETEQFDKIKHIWFISADATIVKMDYLQNMGITNYILKPIIFSDFKSKITKIIQTE